LLSPKKGNASFESFLISFANFLKLISDIAPRGLNIPVADGPIYKKQITGCAVELSRKPRSERMNCQLFSDSRYSFPPFEPEPDLSCGYRPFWIPSEKQKRL
jgi:hypothetical protein